MAIPLNVHPHFNAEEAASVAAELVQNLDNLPGEVNFLLMEIREKDERISQLVARINTRHHGLTKSVKTLTPTSAPAAATFPLPIPAGTAIPTAHLSTKDAQNMAKIQAEWVRIEALQDEKIKLAERLERIVGRARERAKTEWKRVGGVDMDEIEADVKLGDLGSADVLLPSGGLGSGSHKRRNKPAPLAQSMSSGSLSAMAQSHSPAPSGHMPPPPAPRSGSMGRSRKARDHSASDMDVEVEMETADAEVEPDDALYCFCQQKSYGEMIGCDNDKCQYEWFHVKCVNINGQLPDTWYCPDCVRSLGLSSSDGRKDRKGRRK